MQNYTELVIGFDARENFLKFKDGWDVDRIDTYLLSSDVIKPLSVDVMVWNSFFHTLQIESPDWVGPRQELWDSLERLKDATKSLDYAQWMIGITQWMSITRHHSFEKQYGMIPTAPSREWTLLGFDVADDFLLSGLMNCGYKVDEREPLRQKWAKHLNQYHLFRDADVALEFKFLSDERVWEHRPFNVYAMYLIEAIGTGELLLD